MVHQLTHDPATLAWLTTLFAQLLAQESTRQAAVNLLYSVSQQEHTQQFMSEFARGIVGSQAVSEQVAHLCAFFRC